MIVSVTFLVTIEVIKLELSLFVDNEICHVSELVGLGYLRRCPSGQATVVLIIQLFQLVFLNVLFFIEETQSGLPHLAIDGVFRGHYDGAIERFKCFLVVPLAHQLVVQ